MEQLAGISGGDAVASLYPTAAEARITCAIADAAAKVRDLDFISFHGVRPFFPQLTAQPVKPRRGRARAEPEVEPRRRAHRLIAIREVEAHPARGYVVQASTNLLNWEDVGAFIAVGGAVDFTESATLQPHRYYRILDRDTNLPPPTNNNFSSRIVLATSPAAVVGCIMPRTPSGFARLRKDAHAAVPILAYRTVAKYRGELNILPSNLRRVY